MPDSDYQIADPLLLALREARPVPDEGEYSPEGADAQRLLASITSGERVSPRRFRPRRRRTPVIVAAAAAVVTALALAVPAVVGSGGTHRGAAKPPPVLPSGFQLVDSSAFQFRTVGGGPQSIDLQCVTATICYATTNGGSPQGEAPLPPMVKTTDGGATWKAVNAPFGGMFTLSDGSCPTALVCAVASSAFAAPMMAMTTDGGDHWTTSPIPVPAGDSLGLLTCVDALHCVTYAGDSSSASPSGTFLHTADGGRTWTQATTVPAAADQEPANLRCDDDGACITLVPTGTVNPTNGPDGNTSSVVTLRSADWGATWVAVPAPTPLRSGPGVFLFTCGDASHCLLAYPTPAPESGGAAITIASTADAGTSWQASTAPASWPNIAIDVSCATGLHCWVSVADGTSAGYSNPVIEETTDGGKTFMALPVPSSANGVPMALVGPMSCPVEAGCIGLGLTQAAFEPPVWGGPAQFNDTQSRFIVSDLPLPTGAAQAAQPAARTQPGLPQQYVKVLRAPGVSKAALKVFDYQQLITALGNDRFSSSLHAVPDGSPAPDGIVNVLVTAGAVSVPGSSHKYRWSLWIFDPVSGKPISALGSDEGTWPSFFDAVPGRRLNPTALRAE